MAARNLQKKISVTRLSGKTTIARIVAANGVLNCGQFIGRASGIKQGETDFGVWNALTGNFRGISPDGEVMDSGVCFLPDVAFDMIKGQLDGGAIAVDFAFAITAALDDTSPVGFSYRATPLMDSEETDPVLMLQQKLAAKLALAAPTKAATEAAPEIDEASKPATKTAKK